MKAELKYLYSPDINDLEKFIPKEPDNFSFLLQIMIGEKDKEGEESFDTIVCTPKWLLNEYKTDEILFGYNHLIVFKYDYNKILNTIESYINSIEGDTWDEIANKIGKIGSWEFENYHDKR